MTVLAPFSDVLSTFGKKIGLPMIAFDGDGHCCLGFDDVVVNIGVNQDATQIIVSSPVATLTESPTEGLMLRYLALNHVALLSGTGGLGFDEGTRQLVFVERIPLLGLDEDLFESSMTQVVGRIEALKEMLASPDWTALAMNPTLDSTALMTNVISSNY